MPRAEQPYFIQEGIASFYGGAHQGKRTATGEHFNRADLTAAQNQLQQRPQKEQAEIQHRSPYCSIVLAVFTVKHHGKALGRIAGNG